MLPHWASSQESGGEKRGMCMMEILSRSKKIKFMVEVLLLRVRMLSKVLEKT